MKKRITIILEEEEASILKKLSKIERRLENDQAAVLIREAFVNRGLLKPRRVSAGQGAPDVS